MKILTDEQCVDLGEQMRQSAMDELIKIMAPIGDNPQVLAACALGLAEVVGALVGRAQSKGVPAYRLRREVIGAIEDAIAREAA